MRTFLARALCAIKGHCWEGFLPSGHSWCKRCERYDDHPAVVRMDAILAVVRKWRPLAVKFRRRDVNVTVGWPWVRSLPSLHVRLHLGWNVRGGELPGLHVTLSVWRLHVYAHVGGFWQDEDGENRTLGYFGASFQTYGIPNVVCAIRGHMPEPATILPGYVSCERCEKEIELADADPRKAAAA